METKKKRPLQIMFIDNDRHVRESLKIFFYKSEMGCLIFKSAAEALNALKYQDMDVVVSDYFLPDMDGMAFLSQVGQTFPYIKRVLMATLMNDELKKEIETSNIDGFIEKPLNIVSLETVIHDISRSHKDMIDRI